MENNKCVIYTRVSSVEQKENHSLQAQEEYCRTFAKQKGFTEIKVMGEVAESAKNEDRKEYKKMIDFVLDKRNQVSAVLVHSADRFSRHLASAVSDIEKMRKKGIYLFLISEGISTSDDLGLFMVNFGLNFSQLDNQKRANRTKLGIKSRILLGEYPFPHAPKGYVKDENKRLILDENCGALITKAFKMLIKGYTPIYIKQEMDKLNLCLDIKRWGEVFRNPIYAGLIVSKTNGDIPVQGKHEVLISLREFKLVQEILLKKSKARIKHNPENVKYIPLKTLIKCPQCGNSLTGCIVKKNGYYKCNNNCKINISSEKTGIEFNKLLENIKPNYLYNDQFYQIFKQSFEDIYKDELHRKSVLLREIGTKNTQINNLYDDKYEGKISEDFFNKKFSEYTKSKQKFEDELIQYDSTIPLKETFISECMNELSDVEGLWNKFEYNDKIQLFNLMFNEKLVVKKENSIVNIVDVDLKNAFYC